MAFTSSYTDRLIQQSEYYYGTPEMTPGLSGSFSGSFQGDGSGLTNLPSTSPFPLTGDAQITGSLIVSSSFVDFSGLTDIKTRKFAISSGDYKPGTKVTSASFYDGFVEALDASTDGDFIHCFANDSSSVVTKTFEDKNVTIVGNGYVFKQNGYSNQFQRWNFVSCSFNVYDFTFHRDNTGTGYAHASMFQAKDTTFNLYNAGFSGSSGYALGVRERVIINGGFFKGSHTVLFGYSTPNDGTEIRNAEIYANTEAIDLTGDSIKVIGCNILYSQGITSGQYDAITLTGNSNLIQDCNVEGDTENIYKRAINIGSNTGASVGTRNEIVNCSINQGEIQASGYTDIQGCYVFSEGGRGIVHSGTGSIQNCSIEVPGYPNAGFALQLSGDLVKVSNVTAHGNVAGVNFSGRKQFFNCEFSSKGSTTYAVLYGTNVTDLEINNVTLQNEFANSYSPVRITTSANAKLQINNLSSHQYTKNTSGYSPGITITGASGTKLSLINSSVFNHSVGGDSGTSFVSSITGITGSIIDNFYAEGYKYNSIKAISSSIVNSHFIMKSDGVYAGNEAVIKILGNENIFTNNIFEIDKAHQDNDPVVKIHEGTHHFKNNRFRAAKASGQYLITGSANVSASFVNNVYEVADASYITASNVNNITTGFIDGRGNWHKSQVTSSFDHIEATSFKGDGSQLTNLPISDPFPHTASSAAIISRSIAAGDTDSTALRLFGSGSISESGIFEVEGSAGPLFSVADGLDGVLMEVNNISGLPLFQVSSSNEVFINRGNLTSGVTTATASFAYFTGSFVGDGNSLRNISSTSLNGIGIGNSTVVGDGASSATSYGNAFSNSATSTGGQNVAIGAFSNVKQYGISIGHSVAGGNNTVAIGYNAGNTSGENNVLIGYQPGVNTSGDYNISLGYLAGYDQTSGNGNITIGSGSRGVAGESNQLRIGHADVIAISGSLTTGDIIFYNTASAPNFSGSFQGDGSQLTGITATAGSTSGRVVFTTTSGELTTESGFEYDTSTNQLSVDSLNVIHLTSSFITASRVHTSGSNIFGDDTTDTQTLIGTTKMTGSAQITGSTSILGDAQITGSLTISGSSGVEINNSLLVTGSGANITIANTLSGAQNSFEILNNSNQKIFQVGNQDRIVFGAGATSTDGTSLVWGGTATSQAQYAVVLGYSADHTTGTRGIAIGLHAQSTEIGAIAIGAGASAHKNSVTIGRNVAYSGTPENSLVFSTFGGNNVTYSTSNAFEWYNTHATAPNLRFLAGPTSQSFWSGSGGFFGFGTTTPDAPLTVEGSGSTVFNVIGSEGTLFSVDDDLDGTIFSANDRTGLPVLEASASGEVYIGKSPQSLYTTAVISSTTANISQSIFGLSTSSYDGVFVDYTATSASNARAGSIMSIWNGSNLNFTETTTTDIGDTTNLIIQVAISQSQAQIQSYATTAGYKIKTIIRSI